MANQVKFEESAKGRPLNSNFCSTQCKVEEGTDTSVTYTTNLELCLSAIPLWQRLLTPCDRGIEIDYNTLFCDLATQPYIGLNGYKSKWIHSSTSPLHTGRDPPVAITCSVQELHELQVAVFRGFIQRK